MASQSGAVAADRRPSRVIFSRNAPDDCSGGGGRRLWATSTARPANVIVSSCVHSAHRSRRHSRH